MTANTPAAHTPGPWRVGQEIGVSQLMPHVEILCDKTFVDGMPPTTYHLAEVGYPTSMPGTVGAAERMANARLIAAAPLLLEALQAFMALDKSFTTTCDAHLDEIAKRDPMGRAVKLARAAISAATGDKP